MSVCPASPDTFSLLTEFEFIKAVLCTYSVPVGGIYVVGLFVFGAIGLYLFIRQDSVILPLGVVMMGGGSILSVVEGPVIAIAAILILVVPAGYVALVYNRYSAS